MTRPRIRHLAMFVRDPQAVAKFYQNVLDMELIHTRPSGEHFVSDGHITVALIPHKLEASVPPGLNHFGFHVDSIAEIARRTVAAGVEEPKRRPADRPYAEYRGCDPAGNMFDLSEHGFETAESNEDRIKRKVSV
jgi:catechol 2,3-dioxygenase-like lactoylglutathione lyase family enzyme